MNNVTPEVFEHLNKVDQAHNGLHVATNHCGFDLDLILKVIATDKQSNAKKAKLCSVCILCLYAYFYLYYLTNPK